MALIERILKAASVGPDVTLSVEARPAAEHAMWICACVTMDDAPTWLIYDTDGAGFAWCRVPDQVEPLTLVDARLTAGGHADPTEVLLWLKDQASDPWSGGGAGWDEGNVLEELKRRIHH